MDKTVTVARKASVDTSTIMRQQQQKCSSSPQLLNSEDIVVHDLDPLSKDLKDVSLRDEDNTRNRDVDSAKDGASPLLEAESLPQTFTVKYLGKREARGLWGIKHTRGPVDEMVAVAKALRPGSFLPFLQLRVSCEGVAIAEMPQNQNKNFEAGDYPIDVISYGVQDLVYTRVFAMIVVRGTGAGGTRAAGPAGERSILECHAFVCDGRHNARRLTFALATAFRMFSQKVKSRQARPFAIDLRSAEEIQAELKGGDALDSEA